jgi:GAF domain-containing protein
MSERHVPDTRSVPEDGTRAARDLADYLADIATVITTPHGVASTTDRILRLTVATLDGCDEAGLCLAGRGGEAASTTSDLLLQLEKLQGDLGEGPCVEALTGVDFLYVPDLLDDQRWPSFSRAAVALGLRSAMAYRMSANDETVGALQIYGQLPGAFNAHERVQGLIFATFAGMSLSLITAQRAEQDRIDNLEVALASREIIGQAQGIMIERELITADQAFQPFLAAAEPQAAHRGAGARRHRRRAPFVR